MAYICSRNRYYEKSYFILQYNFKDIIFKIWVGFLRKWFWYLLQVITPPNPAFLWTKSCNKMENIQIVSYANDSSITNPHHQAKLMEIIKDFFSDNEVHELQEVLNETYSDAMDSKWWNEYSKKRKKDRHLSLSILTKFLSHLEVLNYKMRCHG